MALVSDISRKIVLFTINSCSSDSSSFYTLPQSSLSFRCRSCAIDVFTGPGIQAQHYFVFREADLFMSDKVITV